MTQKEKKLLLQDLCARLPYGVIIQMNNHNYLPTKLKSIDIDKELLEIGTIHDVFLDACKPYLRPMSSMTEEEKKEFQEIKLSYHFDEDGYILFDWLNAHYFDYRGLIPMGLALEAPEDMYK